MKYQLILGIINVVIGLACFVLCIVLNRTEKIILTFFPVAVGLGNIAAYISDRRDRKRRMAELAKKWGIEEDEFGNAYIEANYQYEDGE